jgi:hypothetical protein
VPAGEVVAADVDHCAVADQPFGGLLQLLPRRRAVEVVELTSFAVWSIPPAATTAHFASRDVTVDS